MGSVASMFGFGSQPKQKPAAVVTLDNTAARRAKEDEKKKKVALRLAQLATGAGGVLSDADTSKKKLFGN